tara:strand:+ start:503 stop:676 length:174 start_codon:yes stop_codon:yes gene_type:complete
MTITYKLNRNMLGEVNSVIKADDSSCVYCIPFDPDNADYQEYQAWLAEGNTPTPADS